MTEFSEIWQKLSPNQRRFVVEMQSAESKREAAEKVGLTPSTVYRWPKIVDDAIRIMSEDVARAAVQMIAASTHEAALLKIEEMLSDDERVAAAARTEILDRGLGKPSATQNVKLEASIDVTSTDIAASIAKLAARGD